MDILRIIAKKRNAEKLSKEEIQFFVDGVCSGEIKDFQTTSLLMAIFLNGLDFDETYNLTISMAKSGEVIDLSDVGNCFDKHSTGGVSDTTTIVVVPTLAALGVKVAKMSGRSLGFTGGTADKMEVFNGYKNEISPEQFKHLIRQNGASIVSQSEKLAIADRIIYKLRSESGTVENMGLIASSIMSKKLACGAKTIIIDCKYGNGAFMKTIGDAKALAKLMVDIGKKVGVKVCAIISNMNQPLTGFVGNNLEVYSALSVLNGEENNLSKLSKFIVAKALVMDGVARDIESGLRMASEKIKSGSAKEKLKTIVLAQGGDISIIDSPQLLLPKNNSFSIVAKTAGYVEAINTALLGDLAHKLQIINGEIKRQDDTGFILNVEIGMRVEIGDNLLTCYYNELDNIQEFKAELEKVIIIGSKQLKIKLIEEVIE